jgi:protocatechuate 3,4-dioxygenase beta subunit
MERKDFLKGLGLFGIGLTLVPALKACNSGDGDAAANTTSSGSSAEAATTCEVTPSETEGPFPTHTPSSLLQTDIKGDRTGIPLTININIQNANANNAPLSDVFVDIWHCDKDGNYSEYGGGGMQAIDYTAQHFLRGRQTTNANGNVSFASIFPGWYNGRATHVHVHIYNAASETLLITQIGFPEGTGSDVALVNASAENGYTKGMTGYTYNTQDNVFEDDDADCEIGALTGDISTGFTLVSIIKVAV